MNLLEGARILGGVEGAEGVEGAKGLSQRPLDFSQCSYQISSAASFRLTPVLSKYAGLRSWEIFWVRIPCKDKIST